MQAMAAGLLILLLGSACSFAASEKPTYLEGQLVSTPGLDGFWIDSSGSSSVKDLSVLQATDSVTYQSRGIGDNEEEDVVSIRVARRNAITFVDILIEEDGDSVHFFALADIGKDRIALRGLKEDSLKAIVARAPGTIPHVMRGDQLTLTGSTTQVQAFLIDASLRPGATETMVWHRIPEDAVCNEMPKDTVYRGTGQGRSLLSDFDVDLYHRADSSADVRMRLKMPRVRAIDALFTIDDTVTNPMTSDPVFSTRNPFMVVTKSRIDRRLEMRSIGVGADGYLGAEVYYCHDSFPSSREAIQQLPAPAAAMRIEQGPQYPSVRYMWSKVAGATTYEVLWSEYRQTDFRRLGSWRRALVRDTSFVLSMRNLGEHTWRVRAFAPGIGFGPLSPVQTVPDPRLKK
jgi:hypothetical protein